MLWALLPVAAGPAFADALDDASRPVQLVASIGLWAGWAAVLAATLVPRAATLTAMRVAAPAPLAAAIATAVISGSLVFVTAAESLKPSKRWCWLLRPWRISGSTTEMILSARVPR